MRMERRKKQKEYFGGNRRGLDTEQGQPNCIRPCEVRYDESVMCLRPRCTSTSGRSNTSTANLARRGMRQNVATTKSGLKDDESVSVLKRIHCESPLRKIGAKKSTAISL